MRTAGLCGIISERDLARGLADHGADLLTLRVGDLMTREVSTCSPDDGIDQLMQQMTEGRFRHLPVVEDGRMIGIISIGDVVKHRLQELGARGSHASRLHLRRRLRSRRFGHSRPEALLPRAKDAPLQVGAHRPLVSPSRCATEPASP